MSSLSTSSSSSSSSSSSNPNVRASRSSFYVAETIYQEAESSHHLRKESAFAEHIYEEIAESSSSRPLPPIPEDSSSEAKNGAVKRRSSSIFEGASKYEILHYLRDAKDRIGHADFEMDLDDRDDYDSR